MTPRREDPAKVYDLWCPYCGKKAMLCDSAKVYNGKSYGAAYVCPGFPDCDSYVGCHKGTNKPLGRLANKELRKARGVAHKMFDALWQAKIERKGVSKREARTQGYEWLAKELGIEVSKCHIGEFDVEDCRRVISACAPYFRTPEATS